MGLFELNNDQREFMRNSISNRPHLAREIIATLVIKMVFIYLLWYAFFSNPIDETLTTEQFESTIFGSHQPIQKPQTNTLTLTLEEK